VKTYKTVRASFSSAVLNHKLESKNIVLDFQSYKYTNKDIYIVIPCLIGLTGEVSAGAELPPRNNPNDDKTS
jgi:hypothetical protein